MASGKINRRQANRRSVDEGASNAGNKGHGAISVFILFHLVAITCWAVPVDWLPVVGVRQIVRPYMLWTGLFQSWDMFAPNPLPENAYFKAVVITKKHVRVWDFPRMDELSFGERYKKERYRKFLEGISLEQNAAALPDVVRHIARFYDDPSDPPQKVMLVRYKSEITPGSNDEREPRAKASDFYEEYIEPRDLR